MTSQTVIFDGRPARVDLEVVGDTPFSGSLTFTDTAGAALDLSALTFEAKLIRKAGGTLATATIDDTDAATGVLVVSLTASDTLNTAGVADARWYLRVTDGQVYCDGRVSSSPLGGAGVSLRSGNNIAVMAQAYTGDVGGGVVDHGALTGLTDHDHTQYGYKSDSLAAVANAGAPLVAYDHFGAHPDGTIHNVTSVGHGTGDPITWGDGLTGGGNALYVEECQIVSGVLRNRATKIVAAASIIPPTTATRRTVSVAWATPTNPGLAQLPYYNPLEDDEYCALRLSFIDTAGAPANDGYVCYIEHPSNGANTVVKIVRDDDNIPTTIAGPVDLGRVIDDGEVLTFGYFDNTYFALVGGVEVCRGTDSTYPPSTFDSTGIVLNTNGDYAPGCHWWSMSDGIPAVVDANTTNTTATALAATVADKADAADLVATAIAAASFNEANGFELVGDWDNAATMGVAPGEVYASRHQTIPRTWSRYGLCIDTASGTGGDVLIQAFCAVGDDGEIGAVIQQGSHDANAADSDGSYIVESLDLPWEFWHVVYAPDTNTGTPQVYGGLPRSGGGPATWSANGINRAGSVSNTASTGATLPDMSTYVFDNTSPTGNRLRIETTSVVPVFGGRA